MELKEHWEKVYTTKSDHDVSWYQKVPATSLKLIENLDFTHSDAMIDVGGGNSNLVSQLYRNGYRDLTVLDISSHALERSRNKMGREGENVKWIESDVLAFSPSGKYHLWHDRATFHFLVNQMDRFRYKSILKNSLKPGGYFILATFSKNGPLRCSGLDICQYNADDLMPLFSDSFDLIEEFQEDHQTPSGGIQNFTFSIWKLAN